MKKIICDYCGKESDDITECVLPDYMRHEIKNFNGNVIMTFTSDEIHNVTKDVCLDCRKKIIKLLQLVPNANLYFLMKENH